MFADKLLNMLIYFLKNERAKCSMNCLKETKRRVITTMQASVRISLSCSPQEENGKNSPPKLAITLQRMLE
jgi:hypothetical protein